MPPHNPSDISEIARQVAHEWVNGYRKQHSTPGAEVSDLADRIAAAIRKAQELAEKYRTMYRDELEWRLALMRKTEALEAQLAVAQEGDS